MTLRMWLLRSAGLVGGVYITACLLPGEPTEAERVTFVLRFATPYRVPVGRVEEPLINVLVNGELVGSRSHQLETLDPAVLAVESPFGIRGLARGTGMVRVVYRTAIGEPDTVFPVWTVVARVRLFRDAAIDTFTVLPRLTRIGDTIRLRARAFDANDNVLTAPFVWASTDSFVVRVSSSGLVTAVDEGTATISAMVDSVWAQAEVTVQQRAARVVVAPRIDTLRTVLRTTRFDALAFDSNGVNIRPIKPRWSSSNVNVATVASDGIATATGPGTARIVARVGGASDSATLVVAQVAQFVFISPAFDTLTAIDDTTRVTVLAKDSLGTLIPNPPVTWGVTDTTIASVDPGGLVTARRNGATLVTATSGRHSAFATFVVRQEIATVRFTADTVALHGAGDTARLGVEGFDRNGHPIPTVSRTALTWKSHFAVVASVDTTGLVTAHSDGYATTTLAWSPTGTGAGTLLSDTVSLVVTGAPRELIAFETDGRIGVMLTDGSQSTIVIDRIPETCFDYYYGYSYPCPSAAWQPAWSWDGTRLGFTYAHYGSPSDVYAARPDGSDKLNLTNHGAWDGSPAWSPDGTRIAFVSDRLDENSAIWVMNADGSNPRLLVPSGFSPTWSPDGSRIAFVATGVPGRTDIQVIDAEGLGAPVHLTNDPIPDYQPAWSPDGSRIAFTRPDGDDSGDIWTMNADGSGLTKLADAPPLVSYETPTWSPDGKQIAVIRAEHASYYYGPSVSDLVVMQSDGTGLMVLPRVGYMGKPSWRRAPVGSIALTRAQCAVAAGTRAWAGALMAACR